MEIEYDFTSVHEGIMKREETAPEIMHIRIVLDTLIKDHGMYEILKQFEMLCWQRAKKISIETTVNRAIRGEWEAVAEGLSSVWGNIIKLNELH